jgi:hypothetical protein
MTPTAKTRNETTTHVTTTPTIETTDKTTVMILEVNEAVIETTDQTNATTAIAQRGCFFFLLSQSHMFKKLCKRFKMSDLPPKLIPADPSVHLASDNVSKGEGEKTAFSVPLP